MRGIREPRFHLILKSEKGFYPVSMELNQSDAHFIQFIKNYGPLNISSITCSSSGGAAQTILFYVASV
jgi:hypothetical protein